MKRIYFAGSIRGGRADAELYQRMIRHMKRENVVLTEHIGDLSLSALENGRDNDARIYAQDTAWLRECDLVIAECTCPSLGVGYELAYAERYGKPCHILYDRTRAQLSAMLKGDGWYEIHPYAESEEVFPILDAILAGESADNEKRRSRSEWGGRNRGEWFLPDDDTRPVFTAEEHARSAHGGGAFRLPETAVVFFMGQGVEYLTRRCGGQAYPSPFPGFLYSGSVWRTGDGRLCYLNGGGGAPQAASTVETLSALGVKNIVSVGMYGAFSEKVRVGEIIAPERALVEEGTSLHYAEAPEWSRPDATLLDLAASRLGVRTHPLVSTDAVFRQTFRKEGLWREKGAVGVDMETSAVFSAAKYLGLRAVALLMASDLHPRTPDAPKWAWQMTQEMRCQIAEAGLILARPI